MSILLALGVAGVVVGGIYIYRQIATRHWSLANITSDLDNVVAQLEKHIDFQAGQAAKQRSVAANATLKAQAATDSSVQAQKIASNVKALLGRE